MQLIDNKINKRYKLNLHLTINKICLFILATSFIAISTNNASPIYQAPPVGPQIDQKRPLEPRLDIKLLAPIFSRARFSENNCNKDTEVCSLFVATAIDRYEVIYRRDKSRLEKIKIDSSIFSNPTKKYNLFPLALHWSYDKNAPSANIDINIEWRVLKDVAAYALDVYKSKTSLMDKNSNISSCYLWDLQGFDTFDITVADINEPIQLFNVGSFDSTLCWYRSYRPDGLRTKQSVLFKNIIATETPLPYKSSNMQSQVMALAFKLQVQNLSKSSKEVRTGTMFLFDTAGKMTFATYKLTQNQHYTLAKYNPRAHQQSNENIHFGFDISLESSSIVEQSVSALDLSNSIQVKSIEPLTLADTSGKQLKIIGTSKNLTQTTANEIANTLYSDFNHAHINAINVYHDELCYIRGIDNSKSLHCISKDAPDGRPGGRVNSMFGKNLGKHAIVAFSIYDYNSMAYVDLVYFTKSSNNTIIYTYYHCSLLHNNETALNSVKDFPNSNENCKTVEISWPPIDITYFNLKNQSVNKTTDSLIDDDEIGTDEYGDIAVAESKRVNRASDKCSSRVIAFYGNIVELIEPGTRFTDASSERHLIQPVVVTPGGPTSEIYFQYQAVTSQNGKLFFFTYANTLISINAALQDVQGKCILSLKSSAEEYLQSEALRRFTGNSNEILKNGRYYGYSHCAYDEATGNCQMIPPLDDLHANLSRDPGLYLLDSDFPFNLTPSETNGSTPSSSGMSTPLIIVLIIIVLLICAMLLYFCCFRAGNDDIAQRPGDVPNEQQQQQQQQQQIVKKDSQSMDAFGSNIHKSVRSRLDPEALAKKSQIQQVNSKTANQPMKSTSNTRAVVFKSSKSPSPPGSVRSRSKDKSPILRPHSPGKSPSATGSSGPATARSPLSPNAISPSKSAKSAIAKSKSKQGPRSKKSHASSKMKPTKSTKSTKSARSQNSNKEAKSSKA